ncbi:DIP1984 family protein [Neobacillus mesonae]|nr:DIP1984 family protein [Neobacillus mesonae]
MKLAEALILRTDTQRKMHQYSYRLQNAVKVQEGEAPLEDPSELIAEMNQSLDLYTELVQQINRTNAQVMLGDGLSIADALALREKYDKQRGMLQEAIHYATIRQERTSKSEIKFVTTIDVKTLQKQVDEISKQHRLLDTRIQEKNWTTDLIQ